MVLRRGRRVIVHTKSDQTIEGILVRKRPEVVLEYADLVTGEGDAGKVELKGRVVVLREDVRFFQVLR